jgi:hypothetical protein
MPNLQCDVELDRADVPGAPCKMRQVAHTRRTVAQARQVIWLRPPRPVSHSADATRARLSHSADATRARCTRADNTGPQSRWDL